MSKAPSMPMYWDAYLADTTHLTTEEHGAYMLLLGAMWRRNGWVPDDDRDNARILGLTTGKWRKIKARLSDFLMFRDGEISQKKLLETWESTQEKIEKNRTNGAKGGRPRARKNNDLGKASGSVSVNPNETIPEPEPEPEPKETHVQDDLFEEFWRECPRKVGKGNARPAFKRALKKASAGQIIEGMKRFARVSAGTEPRYVAHPATWLNGERWDDDLRPRPVSKQKSNGGQLSHIEWMRKVGRLG